ncbi:phenylalanine--tRNA ligase beta subunit-related protein [Micromonospora sp. WMMD1076]|uniref:B3/B4 domain-containing protein n=1 Tax=Micromonospora sp. WMMD1076 TaxID=3016103 RepID=UPI00249A3AE1|nr:phenylalanine--tRNA ligase beta subunit-related protein [Micromonospora sp. WMMD1076]WFF05338.1 phenylalanine--tRNA ligase beta subunit-related protein [Micromonospora sp. WMMD1076]
MRFRHSPEIWSAFPELTCGVLHATGITPDADVTPRLAGCLGAARDRLAAGPEGGFPEIQAWRRAFTEWAARRPATAARPSRCCAGCSRDGNLPRLHPLVDLGNALSTRYAVPVAVLDLARIDGDLTVRPADGTESHLGLGGEREQPAPGEVIFADQDGHAHARRWCHRQSGASAVRAGTTEVLVVVEAMHDRAAPTVRRMLDDLAAALDELWRVPSRTALLTADAPEFAVPVRTC